MNKIVGILILMLSFSLLVEAKHAKVKKTNNSGNTMTQQYREGMSKRLSVEEKKKILTILDEALKVVNKEKKLTEENSPFGVYSHVEPKFGVLKRKIYKSDLVAINFSRKDESSTWGSYVSISLDMNNFTITDFSQRDFDSLGLVFEHVLEGTYVAVKTPAGERLGKLTDLPCYNYQFRLKTNNKIRIEFMVFPEMMNKNELFPRNFKSASIFRDE